MAVDIPPLLWKLTNPAIFNQPDKGKSWRLELLDLDWLQCAVCVDDWQLVSYILSTNVVNHDHYQGPSGPVNHPVHLACVTGSDESLPMLLQYFGDVEKGEITIMVRRSSSQGKLCFRPPGESLKGNILQLADRNERSLAGLYRFYFKQATLYPQGISVASIQQMWNILDRLCSRISSWQVYVEVFWSMRSRKNRAFFIFHCASALPSMDQQIPVGSIRDFSRCLTPTMLSFTTKTQLQSMAKASDPCYHCSSSHRSGNPTALQKGCVRIEKVLRKLYAELHGRTLQQECVLAVLKSVGGSCTRTVHIPMAGGLRPLFKVPFWDEWKALTGVSE